MPIHDLTSIVDDQNPTAQGVPTQLKVNDDRSINTTVISMPGKESADNAIHTTLTNGQVYTGTWEDAINYGSITVGISATQASATNGLSIDWSHNGIVKDQDDVFTINAGAGKVFTFGAANRYYRIVYTNGVASSDVDLQVILKSAYIKPSSHRIADNIIGDDDAELVKSVLTALSDTGSFVNIGATKHNNLRVTDAESGLAIMQGLVIGTTAVHKFGRNPDINTIDGFEAIWNGGAHYTGHDATGAEIVEVFSGSNEDGAGTQTGALTIQVYGLDASYNEQNEIITLTGTTPANSSLSYIRLNRMLIRTAGSTGNNIGQITCRQTVTTAVIFAVMPIGYNQTMIAAYTIPAGKTGYIASWFASLANKQTAFSNVRFLVRPFGEVFQVKEEFTIASSGNSYVQRDYILPKNDLAAKADIILEADASVNNLGVAAGFDITLVDD